MASTTTNARVNNNLVLAVEQAVLIERPALLATLATLVHLIRDQPLHQVQSHVDVLFQLNVALSLSDPTVEDTNVRTLAIHELVMNDDVDLLVDYVADLPTLGVQENGPSAGVPAGGQAPLPPVAGRSTRNTPAAKPLNTPTTRYTTKATSWRWLKGYLSARVVQSRSGRTMDPGKSYPLQWWLKTCSIAGIRAKGSLGTQPTIQVLDRDGTTWLTASLS